MKMEEKEERPITGSITTMIKPDVEQGGAVFHLDHFMTELMNIVAGEMMLVTFKENKIILERCDWFDEQMEDVPTRWGKNVYGDQ